MKTFKIYLRPILTSAIVTLILALIMLKVTLDFQLLLFIGSVLFFVAGFMNSSSGANPIAAAVIITVIYLTLFSLLVLNQLPGLYFFIPIYLLACLLGLYFRARRKMVGMISLLLIATMFFLAVKIIPKNIENSLTQLKSEPLPNIELIDLDGNRVWSNTLKGKVLVLDFFGTWCAPCRKELPELQKVKNAFQHNDDVIFFVINANIGGDTPQKFKDFIAGHNYSFNFVYDHDSKIYKTLKLENSGLPTLLIVDKNQVIKMQHTGYNSAETNFQELLISTIKGLL